MKISSLLLSSALAIAPMTLSAHAEIPNIARAMLDSAIETNDPAKIAAVQEALVDVFPDNAEEISQVASASIEEIAQAAKVEEIAEAEAAKQAESGGFFALGPWVGKINASAAQSSGNAETLAVGLAFDAARDVGKFVHNINGYVDIASAAGIQTQQRWGAAYQLDYKFTDRTYGFGRVAYDEDAFSGFDYRLFFGGGLGHFLYQSEKFTWKVEGGPGYQLSLIDDTDARLSNLAIYAASETDWVIRDGLLFEQDFRVVWTDPTTTFSSITAITAALTKNLATGFAFEYRYETNPPLGRQNTDTVLRANISYGF